MKVTLAFYKQRIKKIRTNKQLKINSQIPQLKRKVNEWYLITSLNIFDKIILKRRCDVNFPVSYSYFFVVKLSKIPG